MPRPGAPAGPGAAGAANGVWPRRSGGARAGAGGQPGRGGPAPRPTRCTVRLPRTTAARVPPNLPLPRGTRKVLATSCPILPSGEAPQLPCTVLGTQLWASCESGRSGPEEEGTSLRPHDLVDVQLQKFSLLPSSQRTGTIIAKN